ncbi:DUF6262 family protein [Nonomuraea sp. NPDC049695]|uniref:DUF6262 family protein n=1 Tax=Nonomuraea sp. NPDC049695 TaxID=3154734 RepID=UPI003449BD36
MTRVLISDDDDLMRAGLAELLSNDPTIDIVGHAATGREAVERASRLRPDVVLIDVRMPDLDGIMATREVSRTALGVRVLILTTFEQDDYIFGALRAGASGFLLKRTRPEELIAARRGRTNQMLKRVRDTLSQMRRDRMEIELAVVARRADVSRTFLYTNNQAQQLLAEAKTDATATSSPSPTRPADATGSWKDRALNAEDAPRAAYAEIGNQRDQISRLLGQIRDLEIDLPADAVERITTENRTLRQDNRKLTTDNQRLTDRLKAARENNRFLDTRIARLEAELVEHLNLGQNPQQDHAADLRTEPGEP